jgi:hypothetical protein
VETGRQGLLDYHTELLPKLQGKAATGQLTREGLGMADGYRCLSLFLIIFAFIGVLSAYSQEETNDPTALMIREKTRLYQPVSRGFIANCSIVGETDSSVTLDIDYTGVPFPDQMILTVLVRDEQLQRIDDFRTVYAELPAAAGRARLTSSLVGRQEPRAVFSQVIQALILNRNDGTVIDTFEIPHAKSWEPEAVTSSESGTGEQEVEEKTAEAEEEAPRIPNEYVIDPKPLGNTPAVQGSQGDSGAGAQHKPAVVMERPALEVLQPQARLTISSSMINAKLNLYDLAPQASWSNGKQVLPFNGSTSDTKGYVIAKGTTVLSDNKSYKNVLLTYPEWVASGNIFGLYEITIPADASALSFSIGFLKGAAGGDGVAFSVRFYSHTQKRNYQLFYEKIKYEGGVVSRKVDLQQQLRGQAGQLVLTVNALDSYYRDLAVWVNPIIY